MKKAIECVLFFADKLGELNMHQISKLLWFADKLHLSRWGKFINNDKYIAMDYGPVPSDMYDHLKMVRDFGYPSDPESENGEIEVINLRVKPRRKPRLDMLSESEVEVLNDIVKKYGECDFNELTQLSHTDDYHKSPRNSIISMDNIIADIDKSGIIKEHLATAYGG